MTESTGQRKPSKLAEYRAALPPGLNREQARKLVNDAAAQDLYLQAIPRVRTSSGAMRVAGITWRDLARWRTQDEFNEREQAARDVIADKLEHEAYKRAVNGERKPIYQAGTLVGYQVEKSDPLLAMLLKAAKPEKYRERSEITVKPIVKVVAGFEPGDVL